MTDREELELLRRLDDACDTTAEVSMKLSDLALHVFERLDEERNAILARRQARQAASNTDKARAMLRAMRNAA